MSSKDKSSRPSRSVRILPPPLPAHSALSQITEQLYLAGLHGVSRPDLMRAAGITHVLNLAADECPRLTYDLGVSDQATTSVKSFMRQSGKHGNPSVVVTQKSARKSSANGNTVEHSVSSGAPVTRSWNPGGAFSEVHKSSNGDNGRKNSAYSSGPGASSTSNGLSLDTSTEAQRPGLDSSLKTTTSSAAATTKSQSNSLIVRRVALRDSADQILLPYLDDFVDFISKAVSAGGTVLVHCSAGVSRSASVVIAYLVREHGISLADAYDHVKACREVIKPNPGFKAALERYEQIVAERHRPKCPSARLEV